jgi:hypothetical protein
MISYFSDRFQCVEVEGGRSGFLNNTIGAFQGSILGPLSFIFYINGIFSIPLKGSIQAYADDIAIVYGLNSQSELKQAIQDDLMTINNFLSSHCLLINPLKTKYLLFHGRASLEYFTERSLQITFNDKIIERVTNFRYLGLIIDERLDFSAHIDYVSDRISPMIYAMKRIRPFVGNDTLLSIYYAHIHSHLIYMNPLWSVSNKDNINRLFVLQKKAIKIIKNVHMLTPSYTLFNERLLPIPLLNELQLVIIAFKIKHNLIKNNVAIKYVNQIHNYNTRRRGDFVIYNHESKFGKADFFRRGLIKFNELPMIFKNIHTLRIFKNRISCYLLDSFVSESATMYN